MQLLRVLREVPVEHRVKRWRALRCVLLAADGKRLDRAVGEHVVRAVHGEHEAQEVARRLGRVQRLFGQAHAERALGAQQQFDAGEAVEAEIALERAVERDRERAAGPRFVDERLNQLQQAAASIVRRGQSRIIDVGHDVSIKSGG